MVERVEEGRVVGPLEEAGVELPPCEERSQVRVEEDVHVAGGDAEVLAPDAQPLPRLSRGPVGDHGVASPDELGGPRLAVEDPGGDRLRRLGELDDLAREAQVAASRLGHGAQHGLDAALRCSRRRGRRQRLLHGPHAPVDVRVVGRAIGERLQQRGPREGACGVLQVGARRADVGLHAERPEHLHRASIEARGAWVHRRRRVLLGEEHVDPLALAGERHRQPDDAPADDEDLGLDRGVRRFIGERSRLVGLILVHDEPPGRTTPLASWDTRVVRGLRLLSIRSGRGSPDRPTGFRRAVCRIFAAAWQGALDQIADELRRASVG